MTQRQCIVVGAGIAGLMSATRLRDAGWDVLVLDKGRGVGGRMATRRLAGEGETTARADHGAQYFTARSAEFGGVVSRWQAAGRLTVWSDGFDDSDGAPHRNGEPRYVGVGGMTALPKALATGLDVRTGAQVTAVSPIADGWRVATTAESYTATAVVMTPPVPQTLALLAAGDVVLPADAAAALATVTYDPVFALMIRVDGRSRVPSPGGVWPVGGEPISWIADNRRKGVSDQLVLTVHAGVATSTRLLEADRDAVTAELLAAAAPWFDGDVLETQLHRWRYSIPRTVLPERALRLDLAAPLAFAGDAFAGPRVEGAALSGMAAAERLLERSA